MKYVVLSLIFLGCAVLHAQNAFEKIDRKEVERQVSDSAGSTFYTRLLSRFQQDDSTLRNADYRLLYYGYVFQPSYSGYPDLSQKEIREAMDRGEYERASRLCDSVLAKYPINLFGNYYKGLALFSRNKDDGAYTRYRDRYHRMMNAIISSGDGLSCETAFKTIFVNDEYFVMYNYFGIKQFNGQALEGFCDRMSVSPSDEFKAEKMYFDTSETLLYMQRLLNK